MDAIGDIARDKGIARERLIEVVQEAVTAAAKRKFKNFTDVEARLNTSNGQIEVFRYKTVTEELADPENQISLEEARALDEAAEPGDEVEYEIDNKEVTRVISQTARQLIFQKIREAERETIFEKFKDRVGEVLNGVVSRTERGRTFITFNQTEAILYGREQIPHERYASGDHIRVILLDVLNDPKEPSQLVISRAHPLLLTKLFEMEVPEIYDGIVEMVAAAREPGRRAKIAVSSNDPDVDPVGACVGMRGSRVQAIISELRGEKIDIIKWADDLPSYIANALAPAELTRIKINDETKEIDVEVEPDQLSLAIGRQGQNVRLASKLTGYKINVSSTSDKAMSLEEQIRERLLASQAELANADYASRQAAGTLAPAESGEGPGEPAEGSGEMAEVSGEMAGSEAMPPEQEAAGADTAELAAAQTAALGAGHGEAAADVASLRPAEDTPAAEPAGATNGGAGTQAEHAAEPVPTPGGSHTGAGADDAAPAEDGAQGPADKSTAE
ncbi:MAG: transcription termination factor NusA [Candidatus Lambdaproteobacteria bacterium]|nr:transcription termination factor NusA [Candidatus Lambdaproteobacteria bacterium]